MRKQDSLRFFMLLRHMTSLSLSIGYIPGKEQYFWLKGSRCGQQRKKCSSVLLGPVPPGKMEGVPGDRMTA